MAWYNLMTVCTEADGAVYFSPLSMIVGVICGMLLAWGVSMVRR